MHFLQAINSDISVLIVCNKTGGTIKGDKKIDKVRTRGGKVISEHRTVKRLWFCTWFLNQCGLNSV